MSNFLGSIEATEVQLSESCIWWQRTGTDLLVW